MAGSGVTVMTGGAVGADTLAQHCAEECGMTVKLFLPPHHHHVSVKHPALSRGQLKLVQPLVSRAGHRISRHPSKNPFVQDLLSRNWFIVESAEAVFAYAQFEDDSLTVVEGGTGMTVQMCVDYNRDFPNLWKEVFVFDESRHRWYELERDEPTDPELDDEYVFTDALGPLVFRECLFAPVLRTTSAVVGSRTLGELGRRTLKDQFNRTVKERMRLQWQVAEKKDEEVDKLCQMFERLSINEKGVATNETEASAKPIAGETVKNVCKRTSQRNKNIIFVVLSTLRHVVSDRLTTPRVLAEVVPRVHR